MAQDTLSPSIRPVTFRRDDDGLPTLGGVRVADLAREFGTPLYVLDAATFRALARHYRQALSNKYSGLSQVLFASKANLSLGMCKLAAQESLGLDVVSGGELYTAVKADFPREAIFFNGNNKSVEEIEMAVQEGIGRILVDNFLELENIHAVAQRRNAQVNLLLRVAPGIEAHTHDYLKTGHNNNKFGFELSQLSMALDAITTTYKDTLCLKGLQCHIGSQIFDVQPFEDLVELMLNLCYNIREQYDGLTMEDMDIGGGLGITYTAEDDPPSIPAFVEPVVEKIQSYAQQLEYPLPRLMLEPGRSLVATAGVTLYTVGSRKEVPGVRTFMAVDGGMGDNIRPALYDALYTAEVVSPKASGTPEETVALVGKYCESGDVLIKEWTGPRLETGDLLMVYGTGAYNYSMSSNYNRLPRPAVVLVEGGEAMPLVRRETYDDILSRDLMPESLL